MVLVHFFHPLPPEWRAGQGFGGGGQHQILFYYLLVAYRDFEIDHFC